MSTVIVSVNGCHVAAASGDYNRWLGRGPDGLKACLLGLELWAKLDVGRLRLQGLIHP